MRVDAFEDDVDLAALGRKLDRVREQIPDDLLQPCRIAGDAVGLGIEHMANLDFLGRGGRHDRFDRAEDDRGKVGRLDIEPHLARDNAIHVEQILNQLCLGAGIALDRFESLLQIVFFRAKVQDLGPAQDRIERVRSSWLSVARKSSLSWLARSASLRAERSRWSSDSRSCSKSLREVTSRVTANCPIRPSGSGSGTACVSSQRRVPWKPMISYSQLCRSPAQTRSCRAIHSVR